MDETCVLSLNTESLTVLCNLFSTSPLRSLEKWRPMNTVLLMRMIYEN